MTQAMRRKVINNTTQKLLITLLITPFHRHTSPVNNFVCDKPAEVPMKGVSRLRCKV